MERAWGQPSCARSSSPVAGSVGFDLGHRLGEHLLSVAPGLGQGPSNPSASTE